MKQLTDLTYRQRLMHVQLFIQNHLDEELPLEKLARIAHFSPFHFHRIFKALVGEGVREHVKRLRLERAALLLKSTDHTVLQIALEAGYQAHEAFSRAFRDLFGISPSELRAGHSPLHSPHQGVLMAPATAVFPVRVEQVPERRVGFLRHIGPYNECGPTFQRLMGWAGPRGLLGPNTLVLGICHDDPEVTPPEKIRYDCCVGVGPNFTPEGEIGLQTIPGGEHAILTLKGPYEKLGEAYRWLFGGWLPSSAREPNTAPAYEVYLNSPMTARPEDLLTEIYLPLKAKK
jgi:AraC family transcriptional regulator